MDSNDVILEPDYKSPQFILQNLAFVSEAYEDISGILSSRAAAFELISYQVSFYCMCALRDLSGRSIAPSILICGAGRMGSKIINSLLAFGCGPLLKIYSRGDVHIRQWRNKGLATSSQLSSLILGNNPDIVILCCNFSGFPQLCNDLLQYMTSSVFVISATFGLEVHRIYHMLKTPGIFRTHVDSAKVKKLMSTAIIPIQTHKKSSVPSYLDTIEITGVSQDGSPIKFSNPVEYSAYLLGESGVDVLNMIRILEDFFAIHGIPPLNAREDAIVTLLGDNSNSAQFSISTPPRSSQSSSAGNRFSDTGSVTPVDECPTPVSSNSSLYSYHNQQHQPRNGNRKSQGKTNRAFLLDTILALINEKVGIIFRKELSRRIRIRDLLQLQNAPVAAVTKLTSADVIGGRRSSLYANNQRERKKKYSYMELMLLSDGRGTPAPTLDEETLLSILKNTASQRKLEEDMFVQALQRKQEGDGSAASNEEYTTIYSKMQTFPPSYLTELQQRLLAAETNSLDIFGENGPEGIKGSSLTSDMDGKELLQQLRSWVHLSEESIINTKKLSRKSSRMSSAADHEADGNALSGRHTASSTREDILSDLPDITSDIRTIRSPVRVHFPEATTLHGSDDFEDEGRRATGAFDEISEGSVVEGVQDYNREDGESQSEGSSASLGLRGGQIDRSVQSLHRNRERRQRSRQLHKHAAIQSTFSD